MLAVAVGVTTIGACDGQNPATKVTTLRSELVRAFEMLRPTEGRFWGQRSYAPMQSPPSREWSRGMLRLIRQRGRLEVAGAQDPDTLGDKALLAVVSGKLDVAIAYLLQGTRLEPSAARLRNDLAVTYMERARRKPAQRGHDLMLAVDAAGNAATLEPKSAEGHFNLALALEELGLTREAAPIWKEYLRLDDGEPWKAEARERLDRLLTLDAVEGTPRNRFEGTIVTGSQARLIDLVTTDPEQARVFAQEDLLGRWAIARVAIDAVTAERNIKAAKGIGTLLALRSQDFTLADAVAAITHGGSESTLNLLATGHIAFYRGILAERADDYHSASAYFGSAAAALNQAGSPFYRQALLELGVCAYYESDYPRSRRLIETAITDADPKRYISLVARGKWLIGLNQLVTRNLLAALSSHREALSAFERLAETQHAAFLHFLVAADLENLGEARLAWQERYRALSSIEAIDDIRRVHSILWEAAQAASSEGKYFAALSFVKELIDDPRLYRRPVVLAEVEAYRAVIEQHLALYTQARRDLLRATACARRVGDTGLQARITADLYRFEGEAELAAGRKGASAALTAALSFYGHAGFAVDELVLRLEEAQAYEIEGQPNLAAAELQRGLAEYDRTRLSLGSDAERQDYTRKSEALTAELIRVKSDVSEPAVAVASMEAARARALLDQLEGSNPAAILLGTARPLAIAEIQRALKPDTALIEYALASKDLFIGVVTRSNVSLTKVPIVRPIPLRRADAGGLSGPAGLSWLEDAYDFALRPIVQALAGVSRLVFVPDSGLAELPFAALRDRRSGSFLVERYTIQVAPSGTVFLRNSARLRSMNAGLRGVMIVRGDAFDRRSFAELAPLEARETVRLSQTVAQNEILEGTRATRAGVLWRIDSKPVLHFATHAIYRPDNPSLSGLLLAAGHDGGLLTVQDIQSIRLRQVQLVVLGACSTVAGGEAGTEGITGIARSFLAAGAPAVLAAIGSVDDAETAELFRVFYDNLALGRSFATALRETQRGALARCTAGAFADRTWAQFELIGGAG